MPLGNEDNFVRAFIAFCKAERGTSEHDANFWSFDQLFDIRDDAEQVWALILSVLAEDQSIPVVQILSAGPLEDLLSDHGTCVIDRVESEARKNPAFASLLGGVWQSSMSQPIWERVQAVRDRRGWDGVPAA
ncbi:MAG TPA: hypothetical protein VF595_14505 [Tepidisphaeraceae bacterium]|jgi:hypothetical protein